MEFQPQTITIKTTEGERSFEAMVGVDTGLAYHRHHAKGGSKFFKTYGVTILSTGLSVQSTIELPTPEAAQRFIDLLTEITDWNKPEEELRKLDLNELKPKVVKAYHQVLATSEVPA